MFLLTRSFCRRLLVATLFTGASLVAAQSVADDITPQELVRDTSSRMLVALHDEQESIREDSGRLYELVSEIVLPYFDFRRMSQWVLGKNWRKATPEQRERFVEQFRLLLVRTYGSALFEYADEKIIYLPFVADSKAKTVTVRTEIELPAATAIPITYSMYRSNAGWKVYDVSISGVSLVTNYRSTFGSIIRKDGMDVLISQMFERNRQVDG
jgi:phospholipid transport system substrate-binding protein